MLGWMRQKRNHAVAMAIFVFITISFVVGFSFTSTPMSATGAGGGYAAKVYEEIITENQVQNAMRNLAQSRPVLDESAAMQVRSDAMDALIEQAVLLHEAKRLGLEVTDDELAEAIKEVPSFIDQGSGKFDYDLYNELYASSAAKTAFESDQRRALLSRKINTLLVASAQVSPVEVEAEYKRASTQMRLAVLSLDPETVEMDIELAEGDIQEYFDGHAADYKKPEEREVEFIAADLAKRTGDLQPKPGEVKAYYDSHADEFKTPVEWKASHILIKTPDGADESVIMEKEKAIKAVLERVQGGADFAAVAGEVSEDAGNAGNGGDLGWFGPGAMVRPFEEAVAAMEKGAVGGPVRTQFGFHIIRLDDIRGGGTRPFDEVKTDIESRLATEMKAKARQEAEAALKSLAEDTQKNANLKAWSEGEGKGWTTYHKTGFFERKTESVAGVGEGLFYSFMDTAFNTPEKDISGTFGNSEQMYILRVLAVHPSEEQPLEAVKDKVREDLTRVRRAEKTGEMANALLTDWKSGKDLAVETAEKKGHAYTETDPFSLSDFAAPVIGASMKFSEAKYGLTPDAPFLEEPVKSQGKVHIVKLLELIPAPLDGLEAQAESLRRRIQMQKAAMMMKQFTDGAVARAREAGEVVVY